MASNSFGNIFKIITWGESHGKAIGVVIDGCPAGVSLINEDINLALLRRAPGQTPHTSPRKEQDLAEIYSGVFEGQTTGAPISILIHNQDVDSSKYEPIKDLLRPGHASFTYLQKYGIFDYRGGGRASARETACRVAAGAVAQKILTHVGIQVFAHLTVVGTVNSAEETCYDNVALLKKTIEESSIFCANPQAEIGMIQALRVAQNEGDSLGGVVEFMATGLTPGLGDPVYEKLEANLAKAMLSLPASKGFEIGEGFRAVNMLGSVHNDEFTLTKNGIQTQTNHAGGTLGGISTGMPLIGRVAFKPTSSVMISQKTLDKEGNSAEFKLPEGSRHDPCVAIRAVPVVEAMVQLVLVDAFLMKRCSTLKHIL
jgi:chorismate synthase